MKHVSLAEARANIAELLDEVERGGTITISLNGAQGPEPTPVFDESRREQGRRAIERLIEMRKTAPHATTEEILAWRDRDGAENLVVQPSDSERLEQTRRALQGILELRKHNKPVSIEEIIAWKNEGRM
jgi:antitoxin (DNA-binding transcriptional repressor) of toxin-antitoxin stability system